MKYTFMLLLLSCIVLVGCVLEESVDQEVVEEGPLIELYDDGYMNISCENPAWSNEPMNGWIRCESFVVREEVNEDGSSVYQLNLDGCITSVVGDGWYCEARIFQNTLNN
jgi:hypothetical protein